MIEVRNIILPLDYTEEDIERYLMKKLNLKSAPSYEIHKRSLDSRKHDDIHYNLSVYVDVFKDDTPEEKEIKESRFARKINNKNIMLTIPKKYILPHILNTDVREYLDIAPEFRPVIIGSGPCGYHAAVKLAHAGFRPIVLERGKAAEERADDVKEFWENGKLLKDSNVCFGEGGAGTFSDGKLNTGNKDKEGYFAEVLRTFVKYGADPDILYNAKPHIGTDRLIHIMKNMREDIIRLGGEVRFNNTFLDVSLADVVVEYDTPEIPLYDVKVNDPDGEIYHINTYSVVLAIGHSSRDTYKMLNKNEFKMEPKAFAVGVRVEHPAELINKAMYGDEYKKLYGDKLPNADYKLVRHTPNDRTVFSFCMCPGGYVVNSSSEEGYLTVNGMSYSGRNGDNSNSAIVVNVTPEDFGGTDVLAGIKFQEELEKACFELADGAVPIEKYGDFKEAVTRDRSLFMIEASGYTEFGEDFKPNIKGQFKYADLSSILPEFVSESIVMAMPEFGRTIKGFDSDETLFEGVEARTSSPVRVLRDEKMMAPEYPGIFPAGEGAGYAGGITSAAADGIKVHEAVTEYLTDVLIEAYKSHEIKKYTV